MKTQIDLLPTDANIIVLQLEPKIVVSAVIPAHSQQVTIRDTYSDFTHDICNKKCPLYYDPCENDVDYGSEFYLQNETKCPGMVSVRDYGLNLPCRKGQTVETRSFNVRLPAIMWIARDTDSYRPINTLKRYSTSTRGENGKKYQLFYIKEMDKDLILGPFPFPNVYDATGNICWGSNVRPTNIKDANSLYWSSPFNTDLLNDYQFSLMHTLQNRDYVRSLRVSESYKNTVFGSRCFVRKSPCDAIFYSCNPAHVAEVPSQYRLQLPHTSADNLTEGILGWAIWSAHEKTFIIHLVSETADQCFVIRKKTLTDTGKLYPMGTSSIFTS